MVFEHKCDLQRSTTHFQDTNRLNVIRERRLLVSNGRRVAPLRVLITRLIVRACWWAYFRVETRVCDRRGNETIEIVCGDPCVNTYWKQKNSEQAQHPRNSLLIRVDTYLLFQTCHMPSLKPRICTTWSGPISNLAPGFSRVAQLDKQIFTTWQLDFDVYGNVRACKVRNLHVFLKLTSKHLIARNLKNNLRQVGQVWSDKLTPTQLDMPS